MWTLSSVCNHPREPFFLHSCSNDWWNSEGAVDMCNVLWIIFHCDRQWRSTHVMLPSHTLYLHLHLFVLHHQSKAAPHILVVGFIQKRRDSNYIGVEIYTLRSTRCPSPACLLQQKTHACSEGSRGELQAGVQQLLLSLGKHWLFVFFRKKKISCYTSAHTVQIAGRTLTALKMTSDWLSCVWVHLAFGGCSDWWRHWQYTHFLLWAFRSPKCVSAHILSNWIMLRCTFCLT